MSGVIRSGCTGCTSFIDCTGTMLLVGHSAVWIMVLVRPQTGMPDVLVGGDNGLLVAGNSAAAPVVMMCVEFG